LRGEKGERIPVGDMRRAIHSLITDPRRRLVAADRHPKDGSELEDHATLNLFIAACQRLFGPIEGLRLVEEMFQVNGRVIPATIDPTHLKAQTKGGRVFEREHIIDTRDLSDDDPIEKIWLQERAFICRPAAEAIECSDIIVLAFSDLYTSLLAIMCIKGIPEALRDAQRRGAKIWYELPLMSKWGETQGYYPIDFIKKIIEYTHLPHLDALLVNSAPIPEAVCERYWLKEKARPVMGDWGTSAERERYIKRIQAVDLLSEEGLLLPEPLVRHDSRKLGQALQLLDAPKGGWLDNRNIDL
jgi:uncharacterized cofD-like protein